MPTPTRIRILIVDDQAIIRQGLRTILEAQPDLEVVGEAPDGNAAVALAERAAPDVVLMDIRMPNQNGLEATRAILADRPETKIILLTTFDVQEYVVAGIRAGAVGYLLKDSDAHELLESIRLAHGGAAIYRTAQASRALAEAVISPGPAQVDEAVAASPIEPLTEREIDVLQQMAYGRRNAEIAAALHIAEGTIKTHVHRILQKLGVEDRTQAVVFALRRRLVK